MHIYGEAVEAKQRLSGCERGASKVAQRKVDVTVNPLATARVREY